MSARLTLAVIAAQVAAAITAVMLARRQPNHRPVAVVFVVLVALAIHPGGHGHAHPDEASGHGASAGEP